MSELEKIPTSNQDGVIGINSSPEIQEILKLDFTQFIDRFPCSCIGTGERSVDYSLHYIQLERCSLLIDFVDAEISSVSLIDFAQTMFLKID